RTAWTRHCGVHAGLVARLPANDGTKVARYFCDGGYMVADAGEEACPNPQKGWISSHGPDGEVNHVGSFLCRYRDRFLRAGVGFHQGGRAPVGETMEYLIAGITALLLFVYLMIALLRPERF